jgi:hypothetical protein
MSTLQQLTRGEKIAGAAGIVLLIGIIAFPWYHVGIPGYTVNGQTYGGASYDGNAMSGPGSFFGVLAFIVLIALLAEVAIRRFTAVQLPVLPVSWSAAEVAGSAGSAGDQDPLPHRELRLGLLCRSRCRYRPRLRSRGDAPRTATAGCTGGRRAAQLGSVAADSRASH